MPTAPAALLHDRERPDEADPPAGDTARRVPGAVRRFWLDAAPALALYAGVRVLGVLALVVVAHQRGEEGLGRLIRWDAIWVLGVAEHGYQDAGAVPGEPASKDTAFFPLVPALVRAVAALGVPLIAAGFVVVAVSGLAAAVALDRLGRRVLGSRRAGLVVVALWAAWPGAAVLAMVYTEATFVALAAWALHALLRERWLTAGVLCALAGVTRVTAVALAAAVAVAAGAALAEGRGRGRWRPLAAMVLAPSGVLGYWGYLWLRTGMPDAWFRVQRDLWYSAFDAGRYEAGFVGETLARPSAVVPVVAAATVVVSVVLLGVLAVRRAPLPLVVYTAVAVAAALSQTGYWNSKPRFLLSAFPLVLPVAGLLAAPRRRRPATVLTALVLGALVLAGAWYAGYSLVMAGRAP